MINVIIARNNPETYDLPVDTEVLLSFRASADKPIPGIVSADYPHACSHCLLVDTNHCYDFFLCHKEDREDRDSVYLAPVEKPNVQD
jgi:hypothetical protein